ncbi:MAG: VTT domain-containing protein [Proteobacteria bacterium]|nr:VTT domain-containing protein [Pseudomonadota bacterium]
MARRIAEPNSIARRIAALVALGLAAGLVVLAGLPELLTDPEQVRSLIETAGWWGPLGYVLAFGALAPFGAPGILFIVPASLVWPTGLALLFSWLGALLAGVVGFSFARWVARDWVAPRLPRRLRAYDARLARHGLRTVVWIRMLFFLFPPAHWVLGVSRVGFGTFVLGTAVGFVPGVVLTTLVGRGAIQWLAGQPREAWWAVGVVIALWLGVRVWRSRARESAGANPAAATPDEGSRAAGDLGAGNAGERTRP